MSGYHPCAVLGCQDKLSTRHRFPNPEKDRNRYNDWIKRCCNPRLLTLDSKKVYKSQRVCHNHFQATDYTSNMYIKKTAVPTANMPFNIDTCTFEENLDVPLHLSEGGSENQLASIQILVHASSLPSTSKGIFTQECIREQEDHSAQEGRFTASPSYLSRQLDAKRKRGYSSLLHSLNVSRRSKLTREARFLFAQAQKFKRSANVNKIRAATYRKRLKLAQQYINLPNISQLHSEMHDFCIQQLTRKPSHPKGRRYSLEEKILALALYKQSGRAYRFMSKMFTLSSRKTLTTLLNKIPVNPGLSQHVLIHLKSSAKALSKRNKLCALLFDEVALQPHITYDKHTDQLIGIEENTYNILDHALVFMVRGIFKKWKQTICYSFCKGTTKSINLKQQIVKVIEALQDAGLEIIATVCDQGATNVAAVNSLILDARRGYLQRNEIPKRRIIINGKEIIPLYDPPHLIKGIRNNLLTKNLIWETKNSIFTARWQDIVNAFYIDGTCGDLRLMPKITDYHVIPKKIKKMKVSIATQIFSHSVSATIAYMARNNEVSADGKVRMEKHARDTSMLLKFFDDLFDSINGGTRICHPGKPLRGAVTNRSPHKDYWKTCVENIKHMYFQKEGTTEKHIPPSLKNWICTLEGFLDLWDVFSNKQISFFLPRSLNQDPLENYFGEVRQQGVRNVNPTCYQFKSIFKTLLLRSFVNVHSIGANCEDTNDVTLVQMRQFLQLESHDLRDTFSLNNLSQVNNHILSLPKNIIERKLTKNVMGYLAGYISKKLLKKFNCKFCLIHILDDSDKVCSEYIEFTRHKEYDAGKKSLQYCKITFIKSIERLYNLTKFILCNYLITKNVKASIILYLKNHLDFTFICDHKQILIDFIVNFVIDLCLFKFCNSVNRILAGKDTRSKHYKNPVFMQAKKIYTSKLKYRLK